MASPERLVAALTGDGSCLFSAPSTVHRIAAHYRTSFLRVIYNNGGWRAPLLSALAVHPHGYAARANDLGLNFVDPEPDYAGIAAAGGAHARTIKSPEALEGRTYRGRARGARGKVMRVIDAKISAGNRA